MTPDEQIAELKQQLNVHGMTLREHESRLSSLSFNQSAECERIDKLEAHSPENVAAGVWTKIKAAVVWLAPYVLPTILGGLIVLSSQHYGCVPTPVPPGPAPTPVPPGPSPGPQPIPSKSLAVLIVYESVDKLPKEQQSILTATSVRSYLNSHCDKGPDGKTPEWRLYDKDTPMQNESALWQSAMKLPRTTLPWIIISSPNGSFSGPLPGNVADTLSMLQKFGG